MRQQYFVVVLAHSLHGRLRRIQVPHKYLYVLAALVLLSSMAMFGMISSYVRMTLKVSNYNSLRQEVRMLRTRYEALQRDNDQKDHQLASLQSLANEVSAAYGIKRALEGPSDISSEGAVLPTYSQSLEEYNFLRSANYSMIQRTYPRRWQNHVEPSIWPVQGRIMSPFGTRSDPFSGEDAVHKGLDLSAPKGTPVDATGDGIVARAEWSGRYGKLVVIDHGHGMETWYAHLSKIDVVAGQEIRRGEVLGLSGGTGRVTSPHLHYEVHENGSPVNPSHFLRNGPVAMSAQPHLPF
jgi:murein DD-endopeptidase MepM/ murein hydrolase activator NlpD